MERIKILIVEDDPIFAIELTRLIEEDLGYQVAASLDNAADTLQWIRETAVRPDLALLDISLRGDMDGIQLAEELPQIPVIFITSADVPAIYQRARRVMPYGYIVKPVGHITLQSIVEGALLRAGDPSLSADMARLWQEDLVLNNFIFLKNQAGKLVKIDLKEVIAIESEGNYCIIHTGQQRRHVVKISLKRMAMQLPGRIFVQVHRNFMVSLPAIESIDPTDNLIRVAGKDFPMGVSFRNSLLERLRKF